MQNEIRIKRGLGICPNEQKLKTVQCTVFSFCASVGTLTMLAGSEEECHPSSGEMRFAHLGQSP